MGTRAGTHRRLLAGIDETHAIPLVLERPRNVEGLPAALLALIRSCGWADTQRMYSHELGEVPNSYRFRALPNTKESWTRRSV
jgi:hypothetical protein